MFQSTQIWVVYLVQKESKVEIVYPAFSFLIPSAFIQLRNIVIRTGSFEGLINICVCKLKNIELFST